MKSCFSFLCLFLFILQTPLLAQVDTVTGLAARADSLFEHFEEEKALKAYEQVLEKDSLNHTALWKASFLYSRVGFRLEDEDEQKNYYDKARVLAERALEIDSTDSRANFAMAVAMGRKALVSGPRDRVAASKVIKEHVDRAIEADSSNAGAWHVLGRWHFKIANLNFLERLAANALFGGVPRNASNEKAEKAIEKAITLMPEYPLYYYDLARVYDERGREDRAIQTCRKALQLKPVGPDDPKVKNDCRELISELQ